MISIDWGTRVISVPQAFCAFRGGALYDLDTNAFRVALKGLEDTAEGIIHPATHRHNTEVQLGGIGYARILEIINGYTITFEETGTPWVVNLVGSNNNILAVTNLGTVQVSSNNSAGLINISEVQTLVYNNRVEIDPITGGVGINYPIGSSLMPVNNMVDALTIAQARGQAEFFLRQSMTLQGGDFSAGYVFRGKSPLSVQLTLDSAPDISLCEFRDLTLTGVLDGNNVIRDCVVYNLAYANSFIYNCAVFGTLTFAADTSIESCWIAPPAVNQEVLFDFDGHAVTVILSGWTAGRIRVRNMVPGSFLGASGTGGRVVVDAANAGGVVVHGGALGVDNTHANTLDELRDASTAGLVLEDPRTLTVAKFIGLS